MTTVIIDYNSGNLRSAEKSFQLMSEELKLGQVKVSNKPEDVVNADRIVLPGVGAFGSAIKNLDEFNLRDTILEYAKIRQRPLLGICLGMQLMGTSSEEDGLNRGLSFVPVNASKIEVLDLKVPHVGFNQVDFPSDSILYKGLENLSDFYFTHSYKMESDMEINQAMCCYGDDFIASYEQGNIVGTQFHAELSQTNGLKLFENFLEYF